MAERKVEGIQHAPHELEIIARADRYVAFLFVGRFSRHKVECQTEAEARESAQRLADEHGRGAMVYALAEQSSALLVTVPPQSSSALQRKGHSAPLPDHAMPSQKRRRHRNLGADGNLEPEERRFPR